MATISLRRVLRGCAPPPAFKRASICAVAIGYSKLKSGVWSPESGAGVKTDESVAVLTPDPRLQTPDLKLSRAAREQVSLDEVVDVAVEHGVHVAALDLGAGILDHAVGREHVVADLRAERDVGLVRFERSHLGPALL